MENIKEDKAVTSLKVWKQSQHKLKLLSVLERKTMQQTFDDLLTKALEEKSHAKKIV